ncbi:MAG: tetratricopeptide repeat protein [Gaiellaceae bacterium]
MNVTEDTFEQDVIERSRELPVLVDYWAEWCGPCHALAPVLEREVERREGAVALAKVDIDANPGLAAAYRIQGIPAVKAFRDGRVVSEFVGAQSPVAVATFVDALLAPPRIQGVLDELRATGELPEIFAALESGDAERALDLVLTAIPETAPAERERLRELAVAIFDDLGHDDPRTVAYRRRLATALY